MIRFATAADGDAIWEILEPTFRGGETYTVPRDITREEALACWLSPGHEVWLAEECGKALGTYFLCTNQKGGGAHVANCGYVTAAHTFGRGVARAISAHSLERAGARGFRASCGQVTRGFLPSRTGICGRAGDVPGFVKTGSILPVL